MRTTVLSIAASALSALGLALTCALPAAAQATPGGGVQVLDNAVVNEPLHFDVSPALRDIVQQAAPATGLRTVTPILRPKLQQLMAAGRVAGGAVSASRGPLIAATIGLNFDGVNGIPSNPPLGCPDISGSQVAPPDTNMAVGDTQVVQWVNLCYAVFSKSTGALIAGPFAGNHFWSGFGGQCEAQDSGDPIIQWDKANHRWLATQNTFSNGFLVGYHTCIAVSQTADATGSYNRYDFKQPGFPDYPHWGLTPSVYYQAQNDFGLFGSAFVGVNVCAYDGNAMRAGTSAKQVCVLDNSMGTLFDDSMLPADLDSAPGSNGDTTEILLGSIDNANPGTHVYEYVFTVSFRGKGRGTLAGVNGSMPITVPSYSLACGGFGACIPQPSAGSELLDSLGDRLMYRLARFVDSGGTQHFLVTHSVNNTVATAARWYEFTAPSGSTTLTLAQSGNTPDDSHFRWMGSAAMDKFGNIALGYSRSSAAAGDYPSIYLSGHTAGEPAGMTDTESLIHMGGGSQSATAHRWGDYSSMVLDGADSCSFWYTTEYYTVNGSFAWNTRIAGPIKFSSCP